MQAYVDVPSSFSNIYLVDLSPSLCEVARKRFDRLGWNNVTVVCQDARAFRLRDEGPSQEDDTAITRPWDDAYKSEPNARTAKADLITMSYSLSMIPGMDWLTFRGECISAEWRYTDFYSVVDSISTLLHPRGTIGVCDFYGNASIEVVEHHGMLTLKIVQSIVDCGSRNYTGGAFNRHVNWLGRVFWRGRQGIRTCSTA